MRFDGRKLLVEQGSDRKNAAKSLENWLRREARNDLTEQIQALTQKLKCFPQKVFVRGQRTKWGNCSSRGNLSFNWRLVLAPRFVLQYIVAHEMTHLKIQDHSTRFWLTVSGLCPRTNEARQWLAANGPTLLTELL